MPTETEIALRMRALGLHDCAARLARGFDKHLWPTLRQRSPQTHVIFAATHARRFTDFLVAEIGADAAVALLTAGSTDELITRTLESLARSTPDVESPPTEGRPLQRKEE